MISHLPSTPTLAIVIPVFREPDIEPQLQRCLALAPDELIVVETPEEADGEFAARLRDRFSNIRWLRAIRGRAAQMNAGARATNADILLFLHADTELPRAAPSLVRAALSRGALWGRFDVRLSGSHPLFRAIEWLMNARSALTGIATGDQAPFVRRDVFVALGGFAPIELMEDIELSARLRRLAPPARVRAPVVTSSRRWERAGVVRTVIRMWVLRALYALGASPMTLARWYH